MGWREAVERDHRGEMMTSTVRRFLLTAAVFWMLGAMFGFGIASTMYTHGILHLWSQG